MAIPVTGQKGESSAKFAAGALERKILAVTVKTINRDSGKSSKPLGVMSVLSTVFGFDKSELVDEVFIIIELFFRLLL